MPPPPPTAPPHRPSLNPPPPPRGPSAHFYWGGRVAYKSEETSTPWRKTKISRVFVFNIVLCSWGVFEGAGHNGTISSAQFNHF